MWLLLEDVDKNITEEHKLCQRTWLSRREGKFVCKSLRTRKKKVSKLAKI